MKREFKVGSRLVRFQHAKELPAQADWLESVLRETASVRGNDFFAAGKTIQLGWSVLELVENDGVLEVHEPDFDKDPSVDTCNDVSTTLSVLAQQNDVTNPLGIEPYASLFGTSIICAEGVRELDDVILQRLAPKDRFSGWTMKSLADPNREGNYDMVYVYELLQFRPWYLKVLSLPPGYFCVFLGQELDAIIDEKDNEVFRREA